MPAPAFTHALMVGMLSSSIAPAKSETARSRAARCFSRILARPRSRLAQDEALAEQVADGARAGRVGRAGDRDVGLAGKRRVSEALTVERPLHEGEVDIAFVEQRDEVPGVSRQQRHARVRMARQMGGHEPRRDEVCDRARAAEPQGGGVRPGRRLCQAGDVLAQPGFVVLHGQQAAVEKVAGGRGLDAAARLGEQGTAVMRLELANVLGDGGLRDEQGLRRPRVAAVPVDLEERVRAIVEHGASSTHKKSLSHDNLL